MSMELRNSAQTWAKPITLGYGFGDVFGQFSLRKPALQCWDTELWDARQDCRAILSSAKGMQVSNVHEGAHEVCAQVMIWGPI